MAEEPRAKRKIWVVMRRAGELVVKFVANRWVRLVIFVLFILLLLWLLFDRVWRPITDDVPLPLGVSEVNPALDLDVLQSINTNRVERTRYEPSGFENARSVIQVP